MKLRNDFVSNSSSSSFMIKKQDGIIDFFTEFKKLISDLHYVILHFKNREDTKYAHNYLINNEIIEKSFKDNICIIDDKLNTITIQASLFRNENEECVHDCISVITCCDKVELFVQDNFGEEACRLQQLATLAEYKGYDIDTLGMEHDQWIQMKDDLT